MSLLLRLLVKVFISLIAASAGYVVFVGNQYNQVTEENDLLMAKIHQLQGFLDEAKQCGFVQRTLNVLPGVRTLLPQFTEVVAPKYPSAESFVPSWMPDFVRENSRVVDDYQANLDFFEALKASLNEYKTSWENSHFRFFFKAVPAEVEDLEFQNDGIHLISPWWVSLPLFFVTLGALLFETRRKASRDDEEKVAEKNAEDNTTEEENSKFVPEVDPHTVDDDEVTEMATEENQNVSETPVSVHDDVVHSDDSDKKELVEERKTQNEGLKNGKQTEEIKSEVKQAEKVEEVCLKKSPKKQLAERKPKEEASAKRKEVKGQKDVPEKRKMITEFDSYEDIDWDWLVAEFPTGNRFALLADME